MDSSDDETPLLNIPESFNSVAGAPATKRSYDSSDDDDEDISAKVAQLARAAKVEEVSIESDSDDELLGLSSNPKNAGAASSGPVTTSRGRVVQAAERFKPSKRQKDEDDPLLKELQRMAKKKREKDETEKAQQWAIDEMNKENPGMAEEMQEWDDHAGLEGADHSDGEYGDDDNGPTMLARVPELGPPLPSSCRKCPSIGQLAARGSEKFLEVWLEDQATTLHLAKRDCSCACGLILDTALYHGREALSTKAVVAAASLVEQGWAPTQSELLNALCDYGLVQSEMSPALQLLMGPRKPRGVFATGTKVEARYDDGWYQGAITKHNAVTGVYTVIMDTDQDVQSFSDFVGDADFRMPASAEDEEESDDDDGEEACRGRPPTHLLPFLWLLQACFARRRFSLSVEESQGWLELLSNIRAENAVAKACTEAHRRKLPWPGAGHSPSAALDACIAALVEDTVSQEEWRGAGSNVPGLCAKACAFFVNVLRGARRSPLEQVLPATSRGEQVRGLISSTVLRRLAPGSSHEAVETTPIEDLQELLALLGHVVVAKNAASLITFGGKEAHLRELSTVLYHVRQVSEHAVLTRCHGRQATGAVLEQLRALVKLSESWKRQLSNAPQTASLMVARHEIIMLLTRLNPAIPVEELFVPSVAQQPKIDSVFKTTPL